MSTTAAFGPFINFQPEVFIEESETMLVRELLVTARIESSESHINIRVPYTHMRPTNAPGTL